MLFFLTSVAPFSAHAEKVLFHAGSRPLIEEDLAAGTVPQEAWDRFIMGRTNFDLPAHRKGLYGAESLAGTSLYSLYQVLGGKKPWVMMIHVKDDCLTSQATFGGEYSLNLRDGTDRFSKWYRAHRRENRGYEKLCLTEMGGTNYWEEGALYSVGDSAEEEQAKTRVCSPVLDRFLRDEKIKVVFDLVNEDSWYLRDKSCIRTIDGRPNELFDAIFSRQVGNGDNDWMTNMYGDSAKPGTFAGGSTFIALSALSEADINPARRALLESSVRELTRWLGRDQEPARLSFDRNDDHPFILLRAMNAMLAAKDPLALQGALRERLDAMVTALGAACRGKNGVKAENREACDAATARESSMLLQIIGK